MHECETPTANSEYLFVSTWLLATKSFVLPFGYPTSYCVSKCFDHISKMKNIKLLDSVDLKWWNECRWGQTEKEKIVQWIPPQHQIERICSCLVMICLWIRQTKKWLTTMRLSAEWVPNRKWMKNSSLQFWYAKRESFSFIIYYRYVLCPRFLFSMNVRALFFSYSFFVSIMIPRR